MSSTATPASIPLRVSYFAKLREEAGRDGERLVTAARTPAALYAELRARHAFTLEPGHLRVAVNDEFAEWEQPLQPGDHLVFIQPVAGG